MLTQTRQVFQAVKGNGYELRVDRGGYGNGTMVWLLNRVRDDEAHYFFTASTEAKVVEGIASQYCTADQLGLIYPDRPSPADRVYAGASFSAQAG